MLVFNQVEPAGMSVMWHTRMGWGALPAIACMEFLGIYVIGRIVAKAPDSVIYLYFIWTESGIKLHWRLKHSLPDGSFVSVREGGDELPKSDGR